MAWVKFWFTKCHIKCSNLSQRPQRFKALKNRENNRSWEIFSEQTTPSAVSKSAIVSKAQSSLQIGTEKSRLLETRQDTVTLEAKRKKKGQRKIWKIRS